MDAKPFLSEFLTDDDLEGLGKAVVTGYRACDEFMQSNVVTAQFQVGMDMRSRLITPFVEHALTQLYGFTHEVRPNNAHNCWHVRLYKNQLAITAHFLGRGETFRNMPKAAKNRLALTGRNLDLFDAGFDLGKIGYCQLLHHGFISPQEALLAIPDISQTNYLASTLLPLPDVEASKIEQVREEMTIRLLTAYDEERRSNNEGAA